MTLTPTTLVNFQKVSVGKMFSENNNSECHGQSQWGMFFENTLPNHVVLIFSKTPNRVCGLYCVRTMESLIIN